MEAYSIHELYFVYVVEALATTLLYLEMFYASAVNFLIVLRVYFEKRPSMLKCLASGPTFMQVYT
jgi:hypothetical protein